MGKQKRFMAFYNECLRRVPLTPHQRLGQVYFNTLEEYEPEIADEVRATQYDPFHKDKNIGLFFEYVADRLETDLPSKELRYV